MDNDWIASLAEERDTGKKLQEISRAIGDNKSPESANKLLAEFCEELNRKGMLPSLARNYATMNFAQLDLDRNGYICERELDSMLTTELLKGSLSPLERQVLRYMKSNLKELSKANNDEWGFESAISRKDLDAFKAKKATEQEKQVAANLVIEAFGSVEKLRKLDTNNDGIVSKKELSSAAGNNRLSQQERELVDHLTKNRSEICKISNDERLWESGISLKDIRGYVERYKTPSLPDSMKDVDDFSRPAQGPAPESGKLLPDLIREFGKRNFQALDADGNGYLTREEIRRILQSDRWSKTLGEPGIKLLQEIDARLELIQRSNWDEWWYKDTSGITLADLEKYARDQEKNRVELPSTPGDHRLELMVGGVKREYRVHIPPGYDGSKPVPVVYFFHYFLGNDKKLDDYTGMSAKADKENFIVVYPNAVGWLPGRLRQWNLKNNPAYRVDEIAFVGELMDKIESQLKVDKDRVYVAGYSNGGMIAQEVAAKLSHRVSAVACVGGCQNGSEPAAREPVPTLIIHGTNDTLVPYEGRRFTPLFPQMKPVSHSVSFWRNANQSDSYKSEHLSPGIKKETFSSKTTGKDVVLITLAGRGHGWPGSTHSIDGNATPELDGVGIIWDFFSRQKRGR